MKTKIYINYLGKEEQESMTHYLSFLRTNDKESKENLVQMAAELYAKEKDIDIILDNGNAPTAWRSYNRRNDMHFLTIVDFRDKHLTPQALKLMGAADESDRKWGFDWYYAISLCREERELYLISFMDKYSPNWNQEYKVEWYKKLQDIDFPILREDGTIYRMDNALHRAINDKLWAERETFTETDECVYLTVKDQHGNYCTIQGVTIVDVFRTYADKYTGYRNYRRQMASEWEIVDETARKKYEEWKQTAKGLKSDWDKFYGSGIVD